MVLGHGARYWRVASLQADSQAERVCRGSAGATWGRPDRAEGRSSWDAAAAGRLELGDPHSHPGWIRDRGTLASACHRLQAARAAMTLTGLLPLAKGSSQRGSPPEECLGLEGASGRHPTACTAGDELLTVSVLLEVSILKQTPV